MPDGFGRHDLVRVAPAAWETQLRARTDLEGVPHLIDWAQARRPLIVRRYYPGEDTCAVPLGLPLPPVDGKRRIGAALPAADIELCAAPALEDVVGTAPPAWRSSIYGLIALGARHGIVPRPFGALLWQASTGLDYLTPTSDLDLIWPLADGLPPCLLDAIAGIEATAPMRLDGEVILPDGGGVHWRELRETPEAGAVLVKYLDRLEMRPASTLRARIAV